MEKTCFISGAKYILYGIRLILLSSWLWLCQHKLLTALAVSLLLNFGLVFSLLNARGERDRYNKTAYQYEQKVDSLNLIIGRE